MSRVPAPQHNTVPAASFPFFYIEPSKKEYLPIVNKFVGPVTRQQTEEIAPIGNAPTMMRWEDMKAVRLPRVAIAVLESSTFPMALPAPAASFQRRNCFSIPYSCLSLPCTAPTLYPFFRPPGRHPHLQVMPLFFNMSIAIHADPDASKAWGWVQVRDHAGRSWAGIPRTHLLIYLQSCTSWYFSLCLWDEAANWLG